MKRNKEVRAADGDIVQKMRPIILALLKELNGDYCFVCKSTKPKYNIHHKRYGDNVTIYDLELLCFACHLREHGRKVRD